MYASDESKGGGGCKSFQWSIHFSTSQSVRYASVVVQGRGVVLCKEQKQAKD